MTFNQAKDKGWKIKSGEKGTLCEKWIFEEKKVIEDPVTGEKETVYEELEHPKVNYFILFNADQVDGIPEKEKKEPLSRDEQLALADQFVKSSVCSVIEGANETEAYYSPARDEIHLPARDYFYSAGEFLGTAIHEMGHSTGHPSRLARDISGGFGSTSYAKEELVAELSAVFVQSVLRFSYFQDMLRIAPLKNPMLLLHLHSPETAHSGYPSVDSSSSANTPHGL